MFAHFLLLLLNQQVSIYALCKYSYSVFGVSYANTPPRDFFYLPEHTEDNILADYPPVFSVIWRIDGEHRRNHNRYDIKHFSFVAAE